MAEAAESLPANREETGNDVGPGRPPVETRFKPGQSGNPSGRPKSLARKVREVAGGEDGETLVFFLASVMADPKEKTQHRLEATKLLLERGWGKAPQYAPIEQEDPLDMAEAQAEAIALEFQGRIDELAARRSKKP